jgi:pimeloyl-ACP methyl ester carboxylesterase
MRDRLCHISRARRLVFACAVALAACGAASCSGQARVDPLERLHPCATDEGPGDAYCGTLKVFEDRATRAGRQIDLKIVVLPALSNADRRDPLFFLAGGPGQGAAQMATAVRDAFRLVQRDRDIVLVDQRGTGDSNGLECRGDANSLRAISEPDDVALARLRACLEGYDANVRLYTTPIAMDDLDDVREHLGYKQINLYGGSYGTRAALVYLRAHGARVRSVVLDGVAPTDMRLPLFTARDAQAALDRLLMDCDADEACRSAFPSLGDRVRTLLARIEANPPRVRLVHPRTGVADEVDVNARFVASILFGALYSPVTAALLPTLIDRAERNDFQGLVALALAGEQDENLSVGMQLSVICSEDVPRIPPGELDRQRNATIFRSHLMSGPLKACEFWPRGAIDPAYYEPVMSPVPALVLSGAVDPVTPPSWGEDVARHLPNARHVTLPATGHGAISTRCGARLIREFLERGSAEELDPGCAAVIKRPPFFLTPAGPDPSPRKTAAR